MGYTLYAASNLAAPVVWQPVTDVAQSNNGMFSLNLSTTNAEQQFFRLGSP
jgi:hypothetical protein